jgi:ankyrin repeat protein
LEIVSYPGYDITDNLNIIKFLNAHYDNDTYDNFMKKYLNLLDFDILDINKVYTNKDITLLSTAVKLNDLPAIEFLLQRGADFRKIKTKNAEILALIKTHEEYKNKKVKLNALMINDPHKITQGLHGEDFMKRVLNKL